VLERDDDRAHIVLMKPLRLRRLTLAERALAAEMFGDGLDAGRVRLLGLPVWPRAFVAGPRLIVWPARSLPADFGDAPLDLQATFVHELTHVWQAQNGIGLIRAKLKAGDSDASYAYDLDAGPDFTRLNIEQQAMVVEHAFLASRGRPTPFAPELYAETATAWRRA
jgi:hypothetical protein